MLMISRVKLALVQAKVLESSAHKLKCKLMGTRWAKIKKPTVKTAGS